MPDGGSLLLYILAFASAALALQSVMGFGRQVAASTAINKRLKAQGKTATVAEAVQLLRTSRGLNADGEAGLSLAWFNDLVTRSGLTFRPVLWAAGGLLLGAGAGAGVFVGTGSALFAAGAGLAIAIGAPLLVLKVAVGRRETKLSQQLPDALEIVVRSLEAGHPVPTAIALVGREMPDPVGSEFGLASDEIAYGSSLEEAVKKLADRTRQPDVELFAATVRLQAKTGGNLAKLLAVNAATIRARQKMRLKIKAASSEGRASAMILTAAPFMVLAAMQAMTPHFYGEVIHEPLIQWGLGGAFVWMAIGNLIMRKMIRFKV